MSTIVDARFAGGPILVAVGAVSGRPAVELEVPGSALVPLFIAEARSLAAALESVAADADAVREVRRDASTDEYFRVVEDGVVA